MRSNALAALFFAVVPAFAAGQEPQSQTTYVGVKLGAVIPQADDLEGFDNGFAIEGVLGFRMNRNLALELGVGRFSMGMSETGFVPDFGTVTLTEDVVAYPVLASMRASIPVEQVELYGVFGGGLYFMSGEITARAPGFLPATENDTDAPFAFHFGGGLAVRLSPRALLGAEVKYFIGETDLFSDLLAIPSTEFNSVMFGGTLAFSL